MAETFRNRIIEYGVKPADQFLAHPKNARIHPQIQREAMKSALDTVGFVAPVLEAKSGYLVDGHERVWSALQNGNADVPFVRLDIDEDEESFVLATFDPLTGLANYDAAQLDALLQEVNTDSPAIQQMLSQLAADNHLTPPNDPYAEWVGMPEFEQEHQLGIKQIIVHFNSEQDVKAFADLVKQSITMQTKYIWYPEQEKMSAGIVEDEP